MTGEDHMEKRRARKHEEPVLQIIHVSDMHVVNPSYFPKRWLADLRRKIQSVRLLDSLRQELEEGLAGHDPLAPAEFEEFLSTITVDDPVWKGVPTWIVDTGDATTYGDDASFELADDMITRWEASAQATAVLRLHGNHDAWPETFPKFTAPARIANHREKLRRRWYPRHWPERPLTCRTSCGMIQLYGMNSVVHDADVNWRAEGEIKEDRWWELWPQPRDGIQLHKLAKFVDQNTRSGERNLRILATHHPVHYPPPRPRTKMAMRNDGDVARALNSKSQNGVMPIIHLVLSGHTHRLYPPERTLPGLARLCDHPELGLDQCQLVVGSLMQTSAYSERGEWPHQAQVLRFMASSTTPDVIVAERCLVGRRGGMGPYDFAEDAKGKIVEEIAFAV